MELIKHTHATVVLSNGQDTLVIDPGAYTPNSADLVADATAVFITHDHPDHFDAGIVDSALAARSDLRVWAPQSVVDALRQHDGQVVAVAAGDSFAVGGFDVEVVGDLHAPIHPDVPASQNVGYVVDGAVYHPGDSYAVPERDISVLLLPTSGPWAKLDEAVEFVRAVAPSRVLQIHDLMLSDAGRHAFADYIGQLTGRAIETLEPGTAVQV